MPTVHEKHFTLEEARALLPRVKAFAEELVRLKATLDARGYDIHRHRYLGGMGPNGDRAHPGELERLVEVVKTLEAMGVQVKAIDQGLVDFPHIRASGEEVYLCFQAGEDEIRYWHGLTAGLGGRRPISEL